MARTMPILLALLFSLCSQCFACYNSINDSKLPQSTYIIRFALYFLLLELPLYLRSLRKIHPIPENILQFVLGLFIIESAVVYIWFPLENAILCLIPVLSRALLPYFRNCAFIQNILWSNCNAGYSSVCFGSTSLMFSIFILCCILHGTRAVDFRIMRYCGFSEFMDDTLLRFKKGFSKILKTKLSFSGPRRPRRKCSSCY